MYKTIQNTRQLISRVFIILLILPLFSCSSEDPTGSNNSDYHYTQPLETTDEWQTASLNSVGIDDALIENIAQDINDNQFPEVHSVVIIKDNQLVFEEYWRGHDFGFASPNYLGGYLNFDMNTRHNTHSATKSFTSAVVGLAIDHGFINSEDDNIFDYLPEYYDQWNNEGRENITIKHCLMMASGLEWNEWDVGVTADDADLMIFNRYSDPVRFLMLKPIVTEPGSSFYYNGGTVDLLGVLVANATGQSVKDFSRDHLFAPLGITNYNWQTLQPSGITCCHGDIYITPRDMAKFGQLFLDDGQWNGEQIISPGWIQQSTQFHISPEVGWADGYGYLWWLRNFQVNGVTHESFKAMGWGGQEIFVFKELEMVIVFTGANYTTGVPCDFIVEEYILPAVQ
ncbi:serine hydrolase domain-containing protein [Bacteroidota bacterium]